MTSASWQVVGGYLRVLRPPRTARLVAAMFVGRLPNGMFPLGMVFLLHQHSGSYSVAGTALAALMLGTTCSAPLRGRAVDRWGPSRTLIPFVALQTLAMAGLLVTVSARATAVIVIALVTAVGATSSTLGGSMRKMWPTLVRSTRDLPTAYALQALLEDLISVTGPLIVSALLVTAQPMAILIAAQFAALAGTTVFATAPATRAVPGRPARQTRPLGALSTPGMRTLVLTLAAAGMVVGTLYVAVPAFTDGASSAGMVLAAMAASSMAGGLVYGGRTWSTGADRRYLWLAGLFAAATAPLALADTATQLGVLLVLVGLAYAPRMISAYLLLDNLAPADALAEGYTWLVSATAGGTAAGSALAGPLAQYMGPRWVFACAAVLALAGFALVLARRGTLKPDS